MAIYPWINPDWCIYEQHLKHYFTANGITGAGRKRSTVVQWTLANPNSLGPEPIQISEIFGLVKATAATCVIVTAPYLHSVLGSLGSLPLLHVHRTQNTAPKRSFSTLLIHRMRKT